jgi:cytoskeletal protein RodZ
LKCSRDKSQPRRVGMSNRGRSRSQEGQSEVAVGVIALVVFMAICGLLWFVNITVFQPARRETMNNDARNAVGQTQYFQNQYAAIKSYEQKYKNANKTANDFLTDRGGNAVNLTTADSNEYARLRSVATGISNAYSDAVQQYNQDSENPDKGRYRPADLPKHYDAVDLNSIK